MSAFLAKFKHAVLLLMITFKLSAMRTHSPYKPGGHKRMEQAVTFLCRCSVGCDCPFLRTPETFLSDLGKLPPQ